MPTNRRTQKYFKVEFADKRKKYQTILANTKEDAITIAKNKWICGFAISEITPRGR